MPINRWMDKEDMVHMCSTQAVYGWRILLRHRREWNWVICRDVDEPRAYHAEWSKSEREKQILYINAYMRRAFLLINKAKSPKFLWLLEASLVCLETDWNKWNKEMLRTAQLSYLKLIIKWRGFPGGISDKEPTWQGRRPKRCRFNPGFGNIPWWSSWQPTAVFLPGESHGQGSLAGYSP